MFHSAHESSGTWTRSPLAGSTQHISTRTRARDTLKRRWSIGKRSRGINKREISTSRRLRRAIMSSRRALKRRRQGRLGRSILRAIGQEVRRTASSRVLRVRPRRHARRRIGIRIMARAIAEKRGAVVKCVREGAGLGVFRCIANFKLQIEHQCCTFARLRHCCLCPSSRKSPCRHAASKTLSTSFSLLQCFIMTSSV